MNNKRIIFIALTFLGTILACAVPGLQTASAPAPTVDTGILSTMVAETVSAAISLTEQAFSTPTIVPTYTPTPTPTVEIVPSGSALTIQEDGSTLFVDERAGYEITVPAGWLAVRPNSEEFNVSLANDGADNTMLHDQMTADLAGYEGEFDRLYSYILRPDIEKNVIFGFSKLIWDSEDSTLSIDNAAMGKLVQDLESSGSIPGFRADTVQLRENGNAVTMIEIGGRFALSDGQGGTTPFYTTIIFFKPTPASLTRLTFTFVQDYYDQISMDVKSIVESINVTGSQQ